MESGIEPGQTGGGRSLRRAAMRKGIRGTGGGVKGEDALLEQQHEGVEGMARHGRRCGEGRGNAARAAAQMDSRGVGGSAEAEANQPNAWTRDTMLSDRFWENTSHPKEGG
jgi:hypothetical protein